MLLKVNNASLIEDVKKTFLTASATSGTATLTVKDITGFGVGDYIIIGEIGNEGTESIRVHASTAPSGTTITLASNLAATHGIDTPIYRADYNQAEFSRATTLTGTKSVLSTSSIDPSEFYTYYEDTSNTTGYGFIRWKNSSDSTVSSYSGGVNYEHSGTYSSYDRKTLFRMKRKVRKLLAESPDVSQVEDDEIRDALNAKQEDIYQARHWSFAEGERSLASVADQFAYDIDTDLDTERIQLVTYDTQPLATISNTKWKNIHWDSDASSADPSHFKVFNGQIFLWERPSSAATTTTLGAAITSATATSITVASSASFKRGDFYRLKINSEIIYATASTSTTFTGCLRGQEGTTATTHSNGDTVTELNIVLGGQLKPVDMFLGSDRTLIPKPQVIEYGAAADIAYGTLRDKALGDRLVALYDKEVKSLESDYSMKVYGQFSRIKDRSEIISDSSVIRNTNDYPQSINT